MGLRKTEYWPGNATPHEAVAYLASVCDGARRRDGYGFSADDVTVGHHLAHIPPQQWTGDHHVSAHQLVITYRQQLKRAGFAVSDIAAGRTPRRVRPRKLRHLQPHWASDPSGLYQWRWFNGVRWTHHVHPPTTYQNSAPVAQ